MVWAAFCSKGILEMQFVSSKMSLVSFLRRYRQSKMIFQQDNARIHVSKETNAWLKDNTVQELKTAIVSAWSINNRIFQVINRSGGLTDY